MKTRLFTALLLLLLSAGARAADYLGVVYDVGLQFNPGQYSVENFDRDLVGYDMSAIADSLHCNSVRIEGEDIGRLEVAAEIAHANGLKVFFNPWLMNGTAEDVISYMAEAAKAAERLRLKGIDIVFVAGCEYSLFNYGIFPGDSPDERVKSLMLQGKSQKVI